MRFRLKKTLQITIACVCVFIYINFFLLSKDTLLQTPTPYELDINKRHGIDDRQDGTAVLTSLNSNNVDNRSAVVTAAASLSSKPRKYSNSLAIYPGEENDDNDRILDQLNFVPDSVKQKLAAGQSVPLKKILLYNGISGWAVRRGDKTFKEQKCKVPYCELTDSRKSIADADVVVFQGFPRADLKKPRPPGQIWLLYMLESPYHTPRLINFRGVFNWTATYRHDATIVAPYERFTRYNESISTLPLKKNYAEGKTKKVAWFVSNCGARNKRRAYAEELSKYIQVDIYGHCGTLKCPRFQADKCFEMLNKDYKFYLSFENSNCRDYITEKFFVNGLKHDVIPIVMGAAPEDYLRAAPPHSHIHVDNFESPRHLAEYLQRLDKDDNLYNEYFRWKGTGDNINTYFWCRVCALAHDKDRQVTWYEDIEQWWRGENICIGSDSWRHIPRPQKLIQNLPVVKHQV